MTFVPWYTGLSPNAADAVITFMPMLMSVAHQTIYMPTKKMDKRGYDQLDSLSSSPNPETSRLSIIIKNLKERVESLERNQTELMDKLNRLEKKK